MKTMNILICFPISRSLSQYGQTKIRKASALQRSGPFYQFLCLGIHTKTKT